MRYEIYRRLIAGAITGLAALAISSCAYDPYYAGGSYSTGYGDGYGYGISSFSTSVFVGTGSPRRGYDPYAGAYYDYTRRAYYDPYLYGYYPVGYRPRYVSGAPHPGGWSRGSSYCPPPSRVRSYNLTNYRNRTERYQGLGRDRSRNVQYNDGRNSYGSQRSSSDIVAPGGRQGAWRSITISVARSTAANLVASSNAVRKVPIGIASKKGVGRHRGDISR